MRILLVTLTIVTSLTLVAPVQAYVGPGVGVGVIGAVFGVIFAVFLAIIGLLWYPIKRMLKKKQDTTETAETQHKKDE